jgi:hypothetical protein
MDIGRFEVFTAVTMKNVVIWDVAPECFGGPSVLTRVTGVT